MTEFLNEILDYSAKLESCLFGSAYLRLTALPMSPSKMNFAVLRCYEFEGSFFRSLACMSSSSPLYSLSERSKLTLYSCLFMLLFEAFESSELLGFFCFASILGGTKLALSS